MGEGEVGISNLTGALKVLLLFLSILGLVVPSVLGWVNLDTRIDDVEVAQTRHEDADSKQWVKVWDDVDENGKDITNLRLSQIQLETQFLEIIRRLDELKAEIEKWEPTNKR
jgi:hypothetical protein